MIPDDIDRILLNEDDIVPSSGFVESVMDAIREEAKIPQPIPFPWKRAMIGIALMAALLIPAMQFAIRLSVDAESTRSLSTLSQHLFAAVTNAWRAGAGWVTLALFISLGSLAVTKRLISR
ncbi:MAG: hypothetical protein JO108_01770 [Acidobacteriaceae bacterium]|nr:hypothetical protein [Acidobacteriaceae bacterium]